MCYSVLRGKRSSHPRLRPPRHTRSSSSTVLETVSPPPTSYFKGPKLITSRRLVLLCLRNLPTQHILQPLTHTTHLAILATTLLNPNTPQSPTSTLSHPIPKISLPILHLLPRRLPLPTRSPRTRIRQHHLRIKARPQTRRLPRDGDPGLGHAVHGP